MTRAAFSRESPDIRRQALMDAMAQCLAEQGPAGASVRAVCARAGVSPGLLRHYFDGIDALVAATYRDTTMRAQAVLEEAVDAAGPHPRDRLIGYITANFRPPLIDPELLATWTAFWSIVRRRPDMAAIHDETYAAFRVALEKLMQENGLDARQATSAAIALTALIDGLWLELTLAPATFSAQDANVMAVRWLDALIERPLDL